MVLLHAPAGYGKTAVLQQLAQAADVRGLKTSSINLDSADANATHLAERVAHCLPGLGVDTLLGRSGSDFQAFTPEQERRLFVDNAERIVGSEGEKLLLRLLERRCPDLKLFVASRIAPRIGITRLELNGDLASYGVAELSFSRTETAGLLAHHGIEHDEQALTAFHQLTGGWPAAVTLAARHLAGQEQDLESWLTGDQAVPGRLDRYLAEEVYEQLSPELAAFALDLAPLGRFTACFAARLTGNKRADKLIEDLERQGVLAKEDADPFQDWYWFHPLVARFLETVLQRNRPWRLLDIHRQAVDWNRTEGRLSDAVRHAFAAGDGGVAAQLLERASMERRRVGKPTPVADWSGRLSDQDYDRFPLLRTEAACSFATQFAVEAARMHANSVRKHFSDLPPIVRDDLFAVDALIAIYADQPENLVEIAERGLRANEAHDPYTVGTLQLSAALGFVARGRLDRARQAALRARNDNDAAANQFGMALSHMVLGLVHAVEGNLPAAVGEWSTADKVIQGVAQLGFGDAVAIGYLPEVHYEWNLLAETEQYLDRCLGGPIEIMTPDMVTSAYLTAARVATTRGAVAEAYAKLDALEAIALEKAWPRTRYAVDWERIRLCLLARDYEAAGRRRQAIVDHAFVETAGICTHALETEADVIGQLRFDALVAPNPAVFSCLQAAVSRALAKNRKWRAAKLLVVEAVARQTAGDHNAALRTMCSALKQAATGELVRTFIDEGPVAVALVEEIADSRVDGADAVPRHYLETILTAAGSTVLPKMEESPAVVESLSGREMDVLRLVFHGCSNADAAQRLFVSENTVKWHLQHVYSKLGVKNRTAAVAAARSLNLVR